MNVGPIHRMHGPFKIRRTEDYIYDTVGVLVFRSRSEDGKDIAVKAITLSPEHTESEMTKQVKNLDETIQLLLTLEHVNVVRHLRGFSSDTWTKDMHASHYYIVMEFYEGPSLHSAVRQNPVHGELLANWTHDILSGLAYLHRNKIVHRDLKGRNVLLSSKDRATSRLKICDLGDMKRLVASATKPKEVSHSHGTCAYMSPEIIDPGCLSSETDNLGRKTDIWSFGCVLIEMVTGQQPQFFDTSRGQKVRLDAAQNGFKVLRHVASGGRPELLTDWPVSVHGLIDRCLQRDPTLRPSAQQLLDENITVVIAAEAQLRSSPGPDDAAGS